MPGRNGRNTLRVVTGVLGRSRARARELIQGRKKSRIRPTHHFIHIPRNGGSAARHAVGSFVSISSPYYHFRYRDIADKLPNTLIFFSIVRNPWSRTASRYLYARRNSVTWSSKDPRRSYIQAVSFSDYVRDHRVFEIPDHPGQPWMGPMTSWFDQLEWLTDSAGTVVCDCLRFESIERDISDYFGRRVSVKKRNNVKQYDYRSMYTDETAGVVAEMFRADIEYFGFDFEGAATRNIACL